ncbi:MAG: nitroreductase/quinone reductase family protein [Chloroflexota bacterium]
MKSQERPWTWTPPPIVNRIMSTLLRLPLLHRLVSGSILLITFAGRKTGRQYSTPLGYTQKGDVITILTKRFRSWWHNFEEPAPVTVRVRGKDYYGQAHALTDVDTIVPLIAHVVEIAPREAEIFHIRTDGDKPDLDSVREMAPKIVVIRVDLGNEAL